MIKYLKLLLEQGQKADTEVSKRGHYLCFVFALLAWNIWPYFRYEVYYPLVGIALYFGFSYMQVLAPSLFMTIVRVLAANNVAEEFGMRDPTKFTLNEYLSAIVIVALVAFDAYKNRPSWMIRKKD